MLQGLRRGEVQALRAGAFRSVVVWGCLFGLARAAGVAHAGDFAPDHTFRPTRGVLIPGGAISGEADPTAVELNPGQLAHDRGGGLTLVGDVWDKDVPLAGRGWAGFIGLPLFDSGALGLGLQNVRGQAVGPGYPTRWKLNLTYATRLSERLAIGVTWGHLYGDAYGGVDTFDAGLSWRLTNWLAAGAVVEDFARPRLPGETSRLGRRWVGSLTLRPLGSRTLELFGAAFKADELAWSRLSSRFGLRLHFRGGFGLLGEVDLAQRDPTVAPEAGRYDARLSFALTFAFDHAALLLGVNRTGVPESLRRPGAHEAGGTYMATLRGDREATPPRIGTYAARVKLAHLDDERAFADTVVRLAGLCNEPTVAVVLLMLDDVGVSYARIEELRARIQELRAAGKPVVVFARDVGTRELYLAAAADRLVLHPAGDVTFAGLGRVGLFWKGTLDQLGVRADVVRVAEYKGAAEAYTGQQYSAPVRENYEALLGGTYDRVVAAIADGRPRVGGRPAVRTLIDRAIFNPQQAVAVGLADAVADEDGAERLIKEALGRKTLSFQEPEEQRRPSGRWAPRRVAVLFVEGAIIDGKSRRSPLGDEGLVGAETIIAALDHLRERGDVRAVVLRVNSPGGSALGSDRMARALYKLRAAGKPVVVSMGDVAASGGYYVAALGDEIYASPSTLTGSIGVIGMKPDLSGLLGKLGVTAEVLKRGEKADFMSPHRGWTEPERAAMQSRVESLYDVFIGVVAQGRALRGLDSKAKVDAVGRGRVFRGADAFRLGLVDKPGGLVEAIREAARLGRVPASSDGLPEVVALPERGLFDSLRGLGSVESLVHDRSSSDMATLLPVELRAGLRLVTSVWLASDRGVMARLPFEIVE